MVQLLLSSLTSHQDLVRDLNDWPPLSNAFSVKVESLVGEVRSVHGTNPSFTRNINISCVILSSAWQPSQEHCNSNLQAWVLASLTSRLPCLSWLKMQSLMDKLTNTAPWTCTCKLSHISFGFLTSSATPVPRSWGFNSRRELLTSRQSSLRINKSLLVKWTRIRNEMSAASLTFQHRSVMANLGDRPLTRHILCH